MPFKKKKKKLDTGTISLLIAGFAVAGAATGMVGGAALKANSVFRETRSASSQPAAKPVRSSSDALAQCNNALTMKNQELQELRRSVQMLRARIQALSPNGQTSSPQ